MKFQYPLSLLSIVAITSIAPFASAQTYEPTNRIPVADNSLGTQISRTNNNFTIIGGLDRGQNLFHSFSDFSVPTGGAATFDNSLGKQSIITRVTGGNFSDINGLVNTQGANFFLLNPNGIVFGTNAQLNVGQTFVGSTANGVDLVDGGGTAVKFRTNRSGDTQLLTINPNALFNVSRLNMGGGNSQISNFGTLQTANPNQYIGLIGGNVSMNGGKIIAQGAASNINIEADSFSLSNDAQINGSNLGQERGANISIKTKDAVSLLGNASIFSTVSTASEGNSGGQISIRAGSFSLKDGSALGTPSEGSNGAKTPAKGNTGNITITVDDTVDIGGMKNGFSSQIITNVGENAQGDSGDIRIYANSISLRDRALLSTSTRGQGTAGNITLAARNNISITSVGISTSPEQGSVGNGGRISINASSIFLRDGAQLQTANTGGQGNAGNIDIAATGAVDITGSKDGFSSGITTDSLVPSAIGNGGDIRIEASSISLRDGAILSASTFGKGNAGNIKLNAADFITVVGSKIFVVSQSSNGNRSGDVFINSPKITLDSGLITADSVSDNGGNIQIDAKSFSLRRGAQISTNASGTAQQGSNGGNITITAPNGFIVAAPNENSDITANAFSGSGGKVSINTQQNFWISPLNRSELEKRLGTTDPTRLNPFTLPTNDITAISQVNPNLSGQVSITPPQIDITAGLSPLPNNVTDPTNQINPNCSAKAIANNSFTNVGRGGIPATPKDPLNEQEIATNWVRLNPIDAVPSTTIATTPAQLSKPIVEAQGWRRERNGDIVLVARSSIGTLPRQPQPQSGCVDRMSK